MLSPIAFLLLIHETLAIPHQMNHQGRLLDTDGNGLTGSHDLIFRLLDEPENGTEMWTETQTVNFINGYYSVLLGADEINNPLDDTLFANPPLWLELNVDGENLEPRHQLSTVPYAQIAGVAERVDGGQVNATEINVGGQPVVNTSGQWVGPAPDIDFMNLSNRPQGLDDGDDNTQLSQTEVLDYVNGSAVSLGVGSQIDGSDILTGGTLVGALPSDLADGDNDLLAGLACALNELISWDGQHWVCVSDNTLGLTDIADMLNNHSVDLNADTTLNGMEILTVVDDQDTLASLSCQNDGEIARYDLVLEEWYCDSDLDTDTVLNQSEVLAYVNGEALSLATGTQVNGSDAVTADTFNGYLPSDLSDGDNDLLAATTCAPGEIIGYNGNSWICVSDNTLSASDLQSILTNTPMDLNTNTTIGGNTILTTSTDSDTLAALNCSGGQVAKFNQSTGQWACAADIDTDTNLSQTEVVNHVNGQQLNLGAGSQVNGNQILTDADPLSIDWSDISNRPAGLDNGDDNTQRSETEVENFITNGSIDLNVSTTIGGETILTTSTDSDTLAALGCADGQVVKFNLSSGQWACATDIDTDTNLSQTEVVNHVNGQQLNLGAGSQVNNRNIVSQPTTCSDGQYLTFNASTTDWVCSSDAYSSLASLSDVSITTASNNNILRYDGTSWINSPQSSIVNLGNINQQNTVFEETNSSTSIGPSLVLKRRSTAGLSEYLGRIHFKGDVSTSSNTANQSYAQIYGYIEDPDVNSPDGRLVFETQEGSSSIERLRLDSNGVTLADTLDLAGNTLTGTNFDLSNNDLVDIGAVTSSEWDQVQNIGTNNIGNAEWGHVASLDQDLSTTDNPTFGDLTVDTLTVNNAAIDADTLAIGTDDYYAPLVPDRDDQYNGYYNQTDNVFTNVGANHFVVYFRVTLPPKKGSYNLVIKDVILDIDDADASNYIRYVKIKGMGIIGGTNVNIKSESKGMYNATSGELNDFDVSGFKTIAFNRDVGDRINVVVEVYGHVATPYQLDFKTPFIRYAYE